MWFLKGDRNHGQGGQNIHEQRFVTQLLTGPWDQYENIINI